MNFSITRVFSSVALAGFVSACSSYAAVNGSFHLPVEAQWGRSTLAPGDYKIRVLDLTSGAKQVLLEGNGRSMYTMPRAVDPKQDTGASTLQLEEVDGKYFVKQFRSGIDGRVYSFHVPKSASPYKSKSVLVSR